MANLFTLNQLEASNVSSITHTAALGSITPVTSINKLVSRSILDSYQFTYTNTGVKTLTINLTSPISFKNIAIMGLHTGTSISTVRAYNGASLLSTGVTNAEQIRYYPPDLTFYDFTQIMDSTFSTCNKIEIKYVDVSAVDGRIGAIFLGGETYEFDIKPEIVYEFKSTGEKVRTDGGQVYANFLGCYRTCRFETTAISSLTVEQTLVSINYFSGVSNQMIFIPDTNQGYIIYGTQTKPFTIKPLRGRPSDTTWYQELSFQLEEEF